MHGQLSTGFGGRTSLQCPAAKTGWVRGDWADLPITGGCLRWIHAPSSPPRRRCGARKGGRWAVGHFWAASRAVARRRVRGSLGSWFRHQGVPVPRLRSGSAQRQPRRCLALLRRRGRGPPALAQRLLDRSGSACPDSGARPLDASLLSAEPTQRPVHIGHWVGTGWALSEPAALLHRDGRLHRRRRTTEPVLHRHFPVDRQQDERADDDDRGVVDELPGKPGCKWDAQVGSGQ